MTTHLRRLREIYNVSYVEDPRDTSDLDGESTSDEEADDLLGPDRIFFFFL